MNSFAAIPFSLQISIVAIFGLTLGSFVNVCIYRIPKKESVIMPRSRCLSCKTQIYAWDNIPIFSYLLLKGKCRQCNDPISILYPTTEFLTALLISSGLIKFGVSWKFFIFCLLCPALVIISLVDIKHRIIPDIITLPGIFFGLLAGSYLVGLKDSLIGLFLGGGIFFIISEVYYRIRGSVGMGGGDIKFILAAGALSGWQNVLLIIFLSSFLGSLFGIVGLINKKFEAFSEIPFGPFLAVGTLVTYFSGDQITQFYITIVMGGY